LTLDINMNGVPMENGVLKIVRNSSDNAGQHQTITIPLSGSNIRLPLAQYLGSSQKFTPKQIALELGNATTKGTLRIPRGFSLLSLGINAGVDVTVDL
jgi:hypothetical protein